MADCTDKVKAQKSISMAKLVKEGTIIQPNDADIATATLLSLQQSDTQQQLDVTNVDIDLYRYRYRYGGYRYG